MAKMLPMMPKNGGAWTKVTIFITLYAILLESLIEWVVVLYLYGISRVDSKMTPSLVLSLSASFLSVPLVALHSLLAWQYNRITGFGNQKTLLHTACTYLLRLTVLVWLAASVAGLIVVSQRASCLPEDSNASFWEAGVSCELHRAAIIVSVASFITVCVFFCSRELCDRPYDISLLGVYKQGNRPRDGSIFSNSSWESDNLKKEILYLCRRPDATTGHRGLYWSSDDASAIETPIRPPSIRYPSTACLRPQLRVNTNPASVSGDIGSRSTLSPDDSSPGMSPGERSVAMDFNSISRTSTVLTSRTTNDRHMPFPAIAELPAMPEVPAIPANYSHKRAKSSVSSLRRFLPKAFPISLPLSDDPQIRALADPSSSVDLEKQAPKIISAPTTCMSAPQLASTAGLKYKPPPPPPLPTATESNKFSQNLPTTPASPETRRRSMTMNSANAPEVVPHEPPKVRRSRTSYIAAPPPPRSIHHPHHPNYVAPTAPPATQIARSLTRGPSQRTTSLPENVRRQNTRRNGNGANIPSYTSKNNIYEFEASQVPRHSLSQQDPRRVNQRRYDPNHNMPPIPRRNDVEVLYPSTRRARSSTYGGVSAVGNLDSIRESISASVDGNWSGGNVLDQKTYRGANRTSIHGL